MLLTQIDYHLFQTINNLAATFTSINPLGIGGILSKLFYRDRPFVTHVVNQLIQHPANASFPSDHATGAFVIAMSIWLFGKREGIVWLLLAGCIAFSRVWVGVHYPFDVVAGALLGIFAAVGVHQIFAKSIVADKCLLFVIKLYEQTEIKVWRKNIQR